MRHDKVLEQNKNAVRPATTPLVALWRPNFRKVGGFPQSAQNPLLCGKCPTLRKITKKIANHEALKWYSRTPFWDIFLLFLFLKKFRFSLEGLVKVRHLVLARTSDDFGATLPGGSI